MKKKNIIIISICLVIILITLIAGYKIYNFRKYSFSNYRYEYLEKFVSKFKIIDTIEFKNADLKDDYLSYKNIKIKNDYQDFKETDPLYIGSFENGGTYTLTEGDETKATFYFGIETYTIKDLLEYMQAFSAEKDDKGNVKREDKVNIQKFFKANYINDDYDLIKYGLEHKDDNLNIFLDSVNTRKSITLIYAALNRFIGTSNDIYLIEGDYKGYMSVNEKRSTTEVIVRLLGGKNKTYYFCWYYANDYYTLDDIKNFMNFIAIS